MKTLTVERARELLDYDPETGLLTWRQSRGGIKSGAVAGTLHPRGYVYVRVESINYPAHRVVWFLTYGVWPKDQIDHINGVRKDNRLSNLRDATATLNQENRRHPQPNNSSGMLGVFLNKQRGKFQAYIRTNGKVSYHGLYQSKEEAHEAYLQAKRRLHKGCTI